MTGSRHQAARSVFRTALRSPPRANRICVPGDPLVANLSVCVQEVCEKRPSGCHAPQNGGEWDAEAIKLAEEICEIDCGSAVGFTCDANSCLIDFDFDLVEPDLALFEAKRVDTAAAQDAA